MKVTCEINDYSKPTKPNIKVMSCREHGMVSLVTDCGSYTVCGCELVEAVKNALNKYR